MSIELKPCPFCGKPVYIYYSSETGGFYAVHTDELTSDCIIEMPIELNLHGLLRSLNDAYYAWNRRA